MIAPLSSSSAAPLRPITVMPMGCQCMECAPQLVMKAPSQPVAPAAASAIDSKSNTVKSANLVIAQEETAETGEAPADETTAEEQTTEQTPSKPAEEEEELTQEEQAQLAKLRARDREVRAHEQAHAAAGAGLAGAPSYSYQQGPDGKQYAVGGEVGIKTNASSSNPRQAIAQLQQVARAALAPASPSGQDRAVAAQARAQAAQLQAQMAQEAQAKAQEAMQGTAEKSQEALSTGAPQEKKPLLPELPEISMPKAAAGTGSSSAKGASDSSSSQDSRSGAVQPVTTTVVAPPEKKSANTAFGGSQSQDAGIGGLIAAYQQSGASANNKIKPLTPSLGGIVSLNT